MFSATLTLLCMGWISNRLKAIQSKETLGKFMESVLQKSCKIRSLVSDLQRNYICDTARKTHPYSSHGLLCEICQLLSMKCSRRQNTFKNTHTMFQECGVLEIWFGRLGQAVHRAHRYFGQWWSRRLPPKLLGLSNFTSLSWSVLSWCHWVTA